MRIVLLVIGLLCIASGLLWAGQGLGLIMWPADSFMLAQIKWAYIGGATALLGLGIVWLARRR